MTAKIKDRNYLVNFYNATSTDDRHGELETYEAWLERQLLSRIKRLEEIEVRMPTEELYEITVIHNAPYFRKMRVEGGFMYNFYDCKADEYCTDWIFVPIVDLWFRSRMKGEGK